jgi:DNA topoisomerase-1
MKNLVIVESPAKAKTIEKFLGKDFKVLSSFGHIRDLAKKDFVGDMGSEFELNYEIPSDKKSLVTTLKSEAKKADIVWLASDEDREGEAIAWHLYEVLKLKPEKTRRIVFHEITKPAILHAIENPRNIDIALVDAQQARRVLDRIVGFELSPVLWKKIKPALSAGRVQSVAVRLICEREKEINAFTPEAFYRVNALFHAPSAPAMEIKGDLNKRFATEEEARQFLADCVGTSFTVKSVSTKPLHRSPAPPFTTSTLQQEASRRLGFPVNTTMMVAQHLYEQGLITYMRTDSLNLSKLAISALSQEIETEFGKQFVHTRQYHTSSKGAQEAHEAIRPTYPDRRTISGTPQEQKLYNLIWKRTMASQMTDAQLDKTNVDIAIGSRQEIFEASGEVVTFEGFMKVWQADGKQNEDTLLPPLSDGMALDAATISATERFTQPQPRYTEATLVKKMEDLGIGRPSTYAPTISTIQSRDYVRRGENEGTPRQYVMLTLNNGEILRSENTENVGSEKGKLTPTDVGMVVNDFLTENFPDILDYNFTAKVEERFDDIAEGKLPWKKEINNFYVDFHPTIVKVSETRSEHKAGERVLGTDPVSGKPVSVKIGRFGPVVQIGEATDEEKPRFASLHKTQSVATITLEEALKLFELPRTVGEMEGKNVVAAIGRFGPYLRYDKLFVSIPKDMSAETITIDDAIMLIKKKQEAEANKLIKKFDNLDGVQVLNGRFGPYIAYKPEGAKKATNYKIPKGTDPASLTSDDVEAIMAKQDAAVADKKKRK